MDYTTKLAYQSNYWYNDGLKRANIRDLTGAITSLKKSLQYNRDNIASRNLLGLVYYGRGDVVEALTEWVLSKNLQPKENIANYYIIKIKEKKDELDQINQAIKRYNQALDYCYQRCEDLAVLQLKKAIEMHPTYVKAYQLLALLYIMDEQYSEARKNIRIAHKLDKTDDITMRYMHELNQVRKSRNVRLVDDKDTGKKKKRRQTVTYNIGNETIIQPVNAAEKKGVSSLLNLGIGLVIGIGIACFLILPARIQKAKADINNDLRAVSEQSDAKTATIDEQEQKIRSLTDENTQLTSQLAALEGTDGALQATDGLMMAVNAYLTDPEDIETIAGYMEAMEPDENGEEEVKHSNSYETLRKQFLTLVSEKLAAYYYGLGNDSYRNGDYGAAIPNLKRAFTYDNTNADALFYLGNCYRENGDDDKAKEIYAQVMDDFAGTDRASKAETYLAEINNQN